MFSAFLSGMHKPVMWPLKDDALVSLLQAVVHELFDMHG